jgi:hypothetical protein
MNQVSTPVVWMPMVETMMLLVNLTETGSRYQPKAMNPVRRAARLRYDQLRNSPAVMETERLLKSGFWLNDFAEMALAAEAFPKIGFAYQLSREALARAAGGEMHNDPNEGLSRLEIYLAQVAQFWASGQVQDFLRTHADSYREAVSELEKALANGPSTGEMERYFGTTNRSYLNVASLLVPAGFSFGISVNTPDGPLAFHVTGPFIEPDGKLTFSSPIQAESSSEREFIRAFVHPMVERRILDTRPFQDAFMRAKTYMRQLGYEEPSACLEDHLIQAVQASLMAKRGERAVAEALLKFDEESGFIFIAAFMEGLAHYELHRPEYRNFDSYFPVLMDLFTQLRGS